MIHEEICTYEVCKLAKEKGFNEKCNFYYQKGVISTDGCFSRYNKGVEYICSAPTQSLLQRWLREEKRIEVNAFWDNADGIWFSYANEMDAPDLVCTFMPDEFFISYESAIEDALKYALENLI